MRVDRRRVAGKMAAIAAAMAACAVVVGGVWPAGGWQPAVVATVAFALGAATWHVTWHRAAIRANRDSAALPDAPDPERERTVAELQRRADFDDLCQVFNRRRLYEELEQELARCAAGTDKDACGAWLFLDLDHFKDINDSFGHHAGDTLLGSLARALQELAGPDVTLGRIGGDEFGLLVPGADRPQAEAVADRVLTGLRRQTFMIEGQPLQVTASLGIILYPQHGTELADVLAGADLAMYESKRRGRNVYTVHEPRADWQERLKERTTWAQRLRSALSDGRFVLHCQPICPARGGEPRIWELLLRLDEQGHDLVPPLAFLDMADRFGFSGEIDRWVIRQAVRLLAETVPLPVSLAVNVSSKSLSDPELAADIERELLEHAVDPGRLVIEITETAAITDFVIARRFVTAVRELGCRVAMDDFGAGFSSFSQLKDLPVDLLKLDGSFIQNVCHSEADLHIVTALVSVAAGLGKQTVAEFVGDEATQSLLRKIGVDYVQGYYVGRPRPVAVQWPAWSGTDEGAPPTALVR